MSKSTAAAGNTESFVNDEIETQEVVYEDEYDDEDVEYEEVEEEAEEGVDEEADRASEVASTAPGFESPAASRTTEVPVTPAKKTPAKSALASSTLSKVKPGKVTPSKQVREMKMSTPNAAKKHPGPVLSPDRNPFTTTGDWTPSVLSQIEIAFPILTGKNETTNELTRGTKPEARYWKAPVIFKFGSFTSETMRFSNVHIPFHTGKGYGSNYVYLCLPSHVGEAFADAGKRRAPTRVNETSLVPDSQRWWKIANGVENSFGIINQQTKKFHAKSLETIFDSTSAGISCTVILSFKCKAATTEMEPLRPTTARTVAVEVVRGFINEMDINVQMPTRVNREKPKADPVASSSDVATDNLMKRLSELGL